MQLAVSPKAKHILVYNAPNDYTGRPSSMNTPRSPATTLRTSSAPVGANVRTTRELLYAEAENIIFEQIAAARTKPLQLLRGHGCFRLHPQRWHDHHQRRGSCLPALGHQRRRHFARILQSGRELLSELSDWSGVGVERRQPVQRKRERRRISRVSSGARATGAAAAETVNSGADRATSSDRALTIGTRLTEMARRNARWRGPGTPCREVPDISANADPYTGYAEYCTGSARLPLQHMRHHLRDPYGWFGIGGTSLSSPLVSAIVADHDSLWHGLHRQC